MLVDTEASLAKYDKNAPLHSLWYLDNTFYVFKINRLIQWMYVSLYVKSNPFLHILANIQ